MPWIAFGLDEFLHGCAGISVCQSVVVWIYMHHPSSVQLEASWSLKLSFSYLESNKKGWLKKGYLWQNPLKILFILEVILGVLLGACGPSTSSLQAFGVFLSIEFCRRKSF